MEQRENPRHDESGQPHETAEEEAVDAGEDDRPSTEEEIKPGVNQDVSSSEGFSSESGQEASGTDSA